MKSCDCHVMSAGLVKSCVMLLTGLRLIALLTHDCHVMLGSCDYHVLLTGLWLAGLLGSRDYHVLLTDLRLADLVGSCDYHVLLTGLWLIVLLLRAFHVILMESCGCHVMLLADL
jgi:hypothetical protein